MMLKQIKHIIIVLLCISLCWCNWGLKDDSGDAESDIDVAPDTDLHIFDGDTSPDADDDPAEDVPADRPPDVAPDPDPSEPPPEIEDFPPDDGADIAVDDIEADDMATAEEVEEIIEDPEIEDMEAEELPEAWLAGWGRRMRISIDRHDVDENLFHFPVLVLISDSSGNHSDDVTFVFDELTADSGRLKIAVTRADGVTQCYVEIEKWDSASSEAWLWVRVPGISSSENTELYLYYDASRADNSTFVGDTGTLPARRVWDEHYMGVWHLAQDPSSGGPQMRDSTENVHHGTSHGDMTSDDLVDGRIDGALDFDNANDFIDVGDVGSDGWTALTVEAWIYHRDQGDDRVVCKSPSTTPGDHIFAMGAVSGILRVRIATDGDGAGVTDADSNADVLDTDSWQHVAFSWDSSDATIRYYVDSGAEGTAARDGDTIADSSQAAFIANVNLSQNRYFNGLIDEVRISKAPRSAAWIKAAYESGRDHLVDFHGEETP